MDLRRNEQKEETKSEMGGHKNSVFQYTRTRIYHHRRCKSRKMLMLLMTNIESLPNEIVFNILLQLPVEYIYEVIRFVCWNWYRIIRTRDFVYEHLKQSSNGSLGLLIQAGSMNAPSTYDSVRAQGIEPLTYVSMRQQGPDLTIDISIVSCTLEGIMISTSCNGLLLQTDAHSWYHDRCDQGVVYYIENPTTKQRFFLPKFISPKLKTYKDSGLAYVAASKEYKVVVTYGQCWKKECVILTVGVDRSWRHINTQHLPISARKILYGSPLATEGFLHWYSHGIVVTLNAETETLTEFHVPHSCEEKYKSYLSTGTSYLSFATRVCSNNELSWEAWEMKPETGEWIKLLNIDLEDQKHLLAEYGYSPLYLTAIGWLKYKEVMIFHNQRGMSEHYFAYDARTQKIYKFELDFCPRNFFAHVNSLVRLDA